MLHIRGGEGATLDEGQRLVLTAVTRLASTLSALGVLTILLTFCFTKHFRNPMHRLIVINAFYNALDVTCTMISTSGPRAGDTSALCQFQGFLNQIYDIESLRRLEWKYVASITTVTFIPAFVMLFIRTPDKGPMYGGVTLWCAIAPKWVLFRIIIYYVPIWSSIIITIALYLLVGLEIVKRRRVLESITSRMHRATATVTAAGADDDGDIPPVTAVSYPDSSRNSTTADYGGPNGAATTTTTTTIISSSGGGGKSYAASTSTRIIPSNPSSLSFRQYILMPLFFFLALLLVWVAPSTNRVASFAKPGFSSYPLLLVVGFTGSLRGFWNSIVFVVVGMRSWKRRRRREEPDEMALRPVTRG
ncbi:hypothetical protein MYCTH_2112775 [Thermothelomyces thermophilus ATCC 42464]|uniref:Glucose receptor Git3 N-terminal domain-containing protein n=1 Tax=Thermothelomyces thermophilus (strain ATCC 42464 / BCRC 31852 / DSM 1799) TaxID=573729 RepID=G2QLB6_THET4|nr:uncharacterized protein MYCTH_2112775 [Thermothelomyces thermophilus ATCC 42464]AEO60748.1 hypothetical protein MYCTH_2112775 [Thermothelomyces thermophilus ATCC 42464]